MQISQLQLMADKERLRDQLNAAYVYRTNRRRLGCNQPKRRRGR